MGFSDVDLISSIKALSNFTFYREGMAQVVSILLHMFDSSAALDSP